MAAGEPVRENKLISGKNSGYMAAILPTGMRAYSTEISPETGAGGFILPNDRVDVILTPKRPRDDERRRRGIEAHTSETILTDVRVLAIDQTREEKNGQRVVVGKTATLELTPRQAETARRRAPDRHAVAGAAQHRRRRRPSRRSPTTTTAAAASTPFASGFRPRRSPR